MSVIAKVEMITPEEAATLLGRNVRNRNVRIRVVNKYARDLMAGKFVLNGESVKVDENGRLLDGQHRCLACVETGLPFESVVVRGLPPEVQMTIDQGTKRTVSDQLNMQGVAYAHGVAACITILRGLIDTTTLNWATTNAEAFRVLDAFPEIPHYSSFVGKGHMPRGVPDSLMAASATVLDVLNIPMQFDVENGGETAPEQLVKLMAEGFGPAGHPCLVLRNYLMNRRTQIQGYLPLEAKVRVADWLIGKMAAGERVTKVRLPKKIGDNQALKREYAKRLQLADHKGEDQ